MALDKDLWQRSQEIIRKADVVLGEANQALATIRRLMTQLVEIDPGRICPACQLGQHDRHSFCIEYGGCQCKEGARS